MVTTVPQLNAQLLKYSVSRKGKKKKKKKKKKKNKIK